MNDYFRMDTKRVLNLNNILLNIAISAVGLFICSADMDARDINERRLNHYLFESNNYNALIRPVVNSSESLKINFSLALSAIINVDEKNQVMVTNVWLQIYWNDYQLVWNPEEFGDIEQIKINHTHLWTPEIVLFNNADGNFEPSYYPNCIVSNTGTVYIIPPAIYTSSCNINVKYFPFDQQVCDMKFGSWTFEGKTLIYDFKDDVDYLILTDYMKNGAWDIIDCPGRIETVRDTVTGQPKEIIVYELVLRRKTLFYTVNLIIPCFLHAFSCLWVFLLPTDGSEKVTLVISVLVSLVVLLLVLQKILPPSKTIPLIAKYFLFTFIMNVLEISVSIVIVYCSYKSPRTADVMPKWVCWLFLYKLPKFLLMERPDHESRWQQKSCTPPPSYPNTPTIPRANLAVRAAAEAMSAVSTAVLKQRKTKAPQATARAMDSSKDSIRVQDWRQRFSKAHSPGVTMSSSASGSHISDESPTFELREFPAPPPPSSGAAFKPPNGHRCMLLRDSGQSTSHSSDSLDCPPPPPAPSAAASVSARGLAENYAGPSTSSPIAKAGRAFVTAGAAATVPSDPLDSPCGQVEVHHVDARQPQQGGEARLPPQALTKELFSAANAVKYICHQLRNKEDYEEVLDDWKYLAAVVDRLLMIIFVLVSLCGTLGVLVNAPHILEVVDQDEIIRRYDPTR